MEHGFHTHAQHEHDLEHRAQAGDGLAPRIAVLTAVLSTLGAVFAYAGSMRQTDAMLLKNEALLKKAEADDQWAYFQAKSQKQALAMLGARLGSADVAAAYAAEAERYEAEKEAIQSRAKALDSAAEQLNAESVALIRPHVRMAQAMTALQIAIALASIAALTRSRWLVGLSVGAALAGLGAGLLGWFF